MSESQTPLDFSGTVAPASRSCSICNEAIARTYFTVGTQVACERCKTQLELSLQQKPGMPAYLRAALYAIVPGALGAAIWWGVRTYAGYEIGLIAIGIGYFVGMAVMRASGNRGGLAFQLLAVALTYFWITANYVPDIITGFRENAEASAAESADGGAAVAEEASSAGDVVIAVVVLVGFAMAAPFLQGAENIIGLLIIGFGLWQAWSLTKRTELAISGPFDLGAQAS
jgi:hypothetical protein